MKTCIILIFCGLLAVSYGAKQVGNAINLQLDKIDSAIAAIR